MVIPHGHQNTTVRGRARHIRVTHHIARAVHTRALTVPQAKHTVVLPLTAQFCLLAAP